MATTPVFLPGESHGQRSLEGYSPRGHRESDMTERLSTWPGNRAIPENKTQSQKTSFSEKKPIFSVYYVLLTQYLNGISQTFIKTLCVPIWLLIYLASTSFKSGKEYIKAVYCHPAYLTYMQGTSLEMLDWMKHKLESRLPGEISITSVTKMTSSLWQKAKKN